MDNSADIQANRILAALSDLYHDWEAEPARLMENALCDLRHLADKHQLAFSQHDRSAYQLYLQEKAEQGSTR